MTLPPSRRLTLSVWPFVLIAPPELLAAMLLIEAKNITVPLPPLAISVIGLGFSLALALGLLVGARYLVAQPKHARLRTNTATVLIYTVISVVQTSSSIILLDWMTGASSFPALLTALYIASRPVNVVVYAIVIDQFREGLRTMREVNGEVATRLDLARRTNSMLADAEATLREESRSVLAEQVGVPLRRLAREASQRPDAEAADDLDDFIAQRLRPLSHVLHPVSVRLGLISAVASLGERISLDASPALARMDRDGALLDDDVRQQVYRWIREQISGAAPIHVALVVRGRSLEVSVHPAGEGSLDAVQVVAGLREMSPGVVSAPLRGQVPAARELAGSRVTGEPIARVRQRLRDVLTVRLPRRIEFVALLSLGASPMQLVLFRWSVTWQSLVTVLTFSLVAIAVAGLLSMLPQARPTLPGATRVVAEWVATGVLPAICFATLASAFGLYSSVWDNIGLDIFRGIYRFTVTGLLLVIAHGVVVQASRALAAANDALEHEDRRREAILAESRELDADVAEALHRTVQGRLAAAVVMIRLGQRDHAWDIVEDMAGVEIPLLLERMQATEGLLPDPPSGLAFIVHGDEERLPPGLVDDVRTVLGEVAVNAQRHGGATVLDVNIRHGGGMWLITCQDDGGGLPANSSPGLGSRLLDDVTTRHGGRWSIRSTRRGCEVLLEIPDPASSRTLASSSA